VYFSFPKESSASCVQCATDTIQSCFKKQLSNFMSVGELLRTDEVYMFFFVLATVLFHSLHQMHPQKAHVGIESFYIKNRSQASKDQELMVTLRKSILDLATRVFRYSYSTKWFEFMFSLII